MRATIPNLDRVEELAKQIGALLRDPQPGLATWRFALDERLDEIAGFAPVLRVEVLEFDTSGDGRFAKHGEPIWNGGYSQEVADLVRQARCVFTEARDALLDEGNLDQASLEPLVTEIAKLQERLVVFDPVES